MILCPQCKHAYSLEEKVVNLVREKFRGGTMDFQLLFLCNDCKHEWEEVISIDNWLSIKAT